MSSVRTRRCTRCNRPCQATKGICRPCREANPKRRERPCHTCGATTTAKSGTCQPCSVGYTNTPVTEEHALTGGRWRRHGLIHIWHPDPEEPAEVDAA